MKTPGFAKFFAQLQQLNGPQRQQVLAALHPAAGLDRIIVLIDEIRSKGRRCPECAATVFTGTAMPTTCNAFAAAIAAVPSTT